MAVRSITRGNFNINNPTSIGIYSNLTYSVVFTVTIFDLENMLDVLVDQSIISISTNYTRSVNHHE